jgi:uracil-DNA glycosylase
MIFPFGQPVRVLRQVDQTPKRAFVLGVYASAVHARWTRAGKEVVKALAVASEPYLFWRGEGAEEIINRIAIPKSVGELAPAAAQLNGPSGRALDDYVLHPLGLSREEVWLCDLVPHSCMNSGQKKAIEEHYLKRIARHELPLPTVPNVPAELTNEHRRQAILAELQKSEASTLILLGDEPIRWFLRFYCDCPRRLGLFQPYGLLNRYTIAGREMNVLPVVHPRQAARLGTSTEKWFVTHQMWLRGVAASLRV